MLGRHGVPHEWFKLPGRYPVWECARCGETTTRSVFGFFWPDVARRLAPWRFGCRPWEVKA